MGNRPGGTGAIRPRHAAGGAHKPRCQGTPAAPGRWIRCPVPGLVAGAGAVSKSGIGRPETVLTVSCMRKVQIRGCGSALEARLNLRFFQGASWPFSCLTLRIHHADSGGENDDSSTGDPSLMNW